jgi:ribosomal protein L22
MTPDNPQDPAKGKAAEDEQIAAEAAEAKEETAVEAAAEEAPAAEEKPKPKRASRAKKPAAAKAQEDEAAAEAPAAEAEAADEAPAEDKPKPKRASRAKKPAEPKAEKPAPKSKPKAEPARENGQRPVVRAQAKYVRTSARKARLVCDHIRGKSVEEARAILAHTPRAVAEDWQKLLNSAVANAENNHELIGDDLKIVAVYADEGPTLKRFRPRAMGRASRIRKRTSHLSIALTPKEQ